MKDFLKVFAFIKRDFTTIKSYRFAFLLNLFSIIMGIATFYFLSRLFGEKGSEILHNFGGRYFPFVLIGIALSNFLLTALNIFSRSIMDERAMGTLETIVATPTREGVIFLGLSLWNFFLASLMVVVYMTIGVLIFKFDLSRINILSSAVTLFLATIAFSSLGILSSSFIMIFKRGNPINWLFSSVSVLAGGVYFPVEILPNWLQIISKFVPLTYALNALRKSIIQGENIFELNEEITFLFIFAIVLLPISIISFRFALRWVKRNGSLIHY